MQWLVSVPAVFNLYKSWILILFGIRAVPSVKRIVYSTCSIHAAENELVVRDALESDLARRLGFNLADQREVIPEWQRRGLPNYLGPEGKCSSPIFNCEVLIFVAESVIRCTPGEDHTIGFFVSMFVRNSDGVSNGMPETEKGNKRKGGEEPSNRRRKKRRKGKNNQLQITQGQVS
jgi:25S rRNA (cytosine2278-C5)-methyltransferase